MFDKEGFLKLKAQDSNDLKVFAAYLQDSLVSSRDIKYLAKSKILICIFSRFMWEDAEKGLFRDNRRIRSALKFNNVTEVKSKNIDKTQADKFLEFLTIDTNNNEQNIILRRTRIELLLLFFFHSPHSILILFLHTRTPI